MEQFKGTPGPPPGFGNDDVFAEIDKEYLILAEIARQADLYLYGSEIGKEDARIKLQLYLGKLKALGGSR